jgi:hypothetical protein
MQVLNSSHSMTRIFGTDVMSGSTFTYNQSSPFILSAFKAASTPQVQHLAQDSAYCLLSSSSRSSGTEPSCAMLQGTTSDVPWSVIESNGSSVLAVTSASQVQDSSASFLHRPPDIAQICPFLLSSIVLCICRDISSFFRPS